MTLVETSARRTLLEAWLHTVLEHEHWSLSVASAGASFRRYFRVHLDKRSFIVMDAPPAFEDCATFARIAEFFGAAGVTVPMVLASNFEQGFLLLSDFGDTTYLKALNDDNAQHLYQRAINTLIRIQQLPTHNLPLYDADLLQGEMMLFPDWYITHHLGRLPSSSELQVLNDMFALLTQAILAQTQVVVHRDYHSRNLMLISRHSPGVLDFQDAVIGAISYDLVSLFKDAYISWSPAHVARWVREYWQAAQRSGLEVPDHETDFQRDFDWMGVQRQLKILGIFARLCYRDGKAGYLQAMPLVWRYVLETLPRYPELQPLYKLLHTIASERPT
ncbi:MAG: phosphotransferase [Methylophilaceae bacterium]|nr:phosphotransferase [Methylophilaceae bacterium]